MKNVIIDGVEYAPVVKPKEETDPFKKLPIGTIIRQKNTDWVYVKTHANEAMIIQTHPGSEELFSGNYPIGKKLNWGGAFFEVMRLEVVK